MPLKLFVGDEMEKTFMLAQGLAIAVIQLEQKDQAGEAVFAEKLKELRFSAQGNVGVRNHFGKGCLEFFRAD